MKIAELIKLYPWVNNPRIIPMITPFAEKFTDEQWKNINQTEFPKLAPTLDPMYLNAFLEGCIGCARECHARGLPLTFDVIKAIVDSLKTQLETAPIQFQVVFDWLGKVILQKFERAKMSELEMDNLMQLLSSESTRSKLESWPEVGSKFQGKDIRFSYIHHEITLQQFITMVKNASEFSMARRFPLWLPGIEGQRVANEFTDNQLAIFGRVTNPAILQDRELCCSFLRMVLAKVRRLDPKKTGECPGDIFAELVKELQIIFLQVSANVLPEARSTQDSLGWGKGLGSQLTQPPNADHSMKHKLISKYLSKYKEASVPIAEETEALETALRNAANLGDYWDVLYLTGLVKNPNAQSKSNGRTALHWAAECANRTGGRLCFDLLANLEGCDFSIKDKQEKTALDLWDFEQFPDDDLAAKFKALKIGVKKEQSPLVANSTFPPAAPKTESATGSLEHKM